MNVFNAIEIYKRIPGVPSEQNPLRAIRGLWVSGTHTDPIFIESIIKITEASSNKVSVVPYTSVDQDIIDSDSLYLSDVLLNDLDITEYSTLDVSLEESSLTLHDVKMLPLTIISYYTETVDFMPGEDYSDSHIEIYDVMETTPLVVTPMQRPLMTETLVGPEPVLKITDHFSTNLEYDI